MVSTEYAVKCLRNASIWRHHRQGLVSLDGNTGFRFEDGTDLWVASAVKLLHASNECTGVSVDIQNKKAVILSTVAYSPLSTGSSPGSSLPQTSQIELQTKSNVKSQSTIQIISGDEQATNGDLLRPKRGSRTMLMLGPKPVRPILKLLPGANLPAM